MKKTFLGILITMSVLSWISGAFAADCGKFPGPGPEHREMHPPRIPSQQPGLEPFHLGDRHPPEIFPPRELFREIQIEPEKLKELEDLELRYREESIDLECRIRKLELRLDRAMRTDRPSEKEVMKFVDELNIVRGTVFRQEIATRLRVREILGPEMFDRLEDRRSRPRFDPGFRPPRPHSEDPGIPPIPDETE